MAYSAAEILILLFFLQTLTESTSTLTTTSSTPSAGSTTIVWAVNGINTTPYRGLTDMTPPNNESVPYTLPNIGAAGGAFSEPPLGWMTSWQFHCDRPTTPCDSMFGMCDTIAGHCNCFNQAFGLRCEAANEALKNTGVCLISNPCKRGACYDDGISAKCSCPDGYYGDHCQHKMVYAECTQQKMVVNIYPYGFDEMIWDYIPAPRTNDCADGKISGKVLKETSEKGGLERMALFLSKASSYSNRAWSGFAREFFHRGDPCAGDAVLEHSNVPGVTIYSREVYVFYDSSRHHTDTKVKVVCEVGSQGTSGDLQTGLPPPQVNIQLLERVNGRQLFGPIKLGSTLVVKFFVNSMNNANVDDLRVEMCTVSDGMGSQKIIVVDNGCVVPPVGKSFQAGQPGTQFLSLVMYSYSHTSLLHFDCRIRLCDSVIHDECRQTRFCIG